MKRKTLLLTGGSGYLGQHISLKAVERFTLFTGYNSRADQIMAGQPVALNLTHRAETLRIITELKPQAIIHAAAVNPGDGDAEAMWLMNEQGARYVAEAAVAVGARLIHVSTDVVHDGRSAPYADEASPAPLNVYGQSKAAGEAVVRATDPQAAIVRTSLIYGLTVMDRGTAGFVERLKSGQKLVLFNDVIRQPVWVETLAEALLRLVDIDVSGSLNVVGRQALTREAFGRRMLAWWGVEAGDLVQSGRAADISDTIPLDLRMTVDKAEQLLQMTFPGVDDVITKQ
jgi:dTDP-4-dehydrorhamnose reductase